MTKEAFEKPGFYSRMTALVESSSGEKIEINVQQVDFESYSIFDPDGTEYKLEYIIELVTPYCLWCKANHHPRQAPEFCSHSRWSKK